ncbi:hypothetical protein GCM10025867_05090 [Frondihabitans sucicola]|uniref:Uncharacterized protein n=1 Tax=Frondihabitans sucicola TaxID=1268041 RepID=A0ABN6XTK7_9MICO|nr:hypothetical protein [Frondihabitans sucicola]BDZ48268.1 hypothetical protein GCM10025867_05090 [Frondihabitans sucicola]
MKRSQRASDEGPLDQIRATLARIGQRLGRQRRSDRAVDAALSPVFFIADMPYIVQNVIYLVILIGLFTITLPIHIAYYAWLWFSSWHQDRVTLGEKAQTG